MPVVELESWMKLESSPQFEALTPAQKVWVVSFLSGASALDATKTSYNDASDKSARVHSYEVAKTPRVLEAINVVTGKTLTPRQELLELVRQQIKACEPGSVAAQRFSSQLERLLLGGKTEEPDEPTQKFAVGDIVTQNGQQYRVASVDANGKILAADEVE